MQRRFGGLYSFSILIFDLLLTMVSLYLARLARLYLPWGVALRPRGVRLNLQIYLLALAIWLVIFLLLSVYDPKRTVRFVDELQLVTVAVVASTFVFAGALYLSYRLVPRLLFFYFSVIDLAFLLSFRILVRLLLKVTGLGKPGPERILILGAGKVGMRVAQAVRENEWMGLRMVGFLDDDPRKQGQSLAGFPVLGPLDALFRVIEEEAIDAVIFALPLRAHERLANLVVELQRLPVKVNVVPDFFDLAFFRAHIGELGGIPLIALRESAIEGFPRMVKRAFDLLLASLLFVLLSPLMLIVAIAIKLDSPGPAVFKQERVGENCRPFLMYKFRSMFAHAEERQGDMIQEAEDGRVIHKLKEDPRVTRIGRMLRRTSLDELPQLLNVLKGEMSLVGPRPELPFLVERYAPWQRKRFAVPPGMTGWWQIMGRSERMLHLHTEDDLYYIQNYSLLLDLQILWKTIGVVIKGRGAY